MQRQYAVYKGDQFVMAGTLEEVSKKLGILPSSVKWLSTPAAHKRADKSGSKRMVVEKIDI